MTKEICPICFGYMNCHETLLNYRKCGTCAFTRKDPLVSITRKELNPKGYKLTPEQEQNQEKLLVAMNKVREKWGNPMIVTSGVRSEIDQMYINPKAMHSNHIKGAAVDILDKDGTLKAWCLKNEELFVEVGLWMEDFASTPTWVHFQCVPPRSGKRWFKP